MDFLARLFDPTGFVPRALCGQWTPALIRLHNVSDFLIWTAYLAIPLVLVAFSYKRWQELPFRALFGLFGLFILACGTTHLLEIVMFYYPIYRLAGLIKLVTAAASWGTVIALVYIVPRALAMKSPRALELDIEDRKQIENRLRVSEERFRSSFESAAIGKALVSLEGRWLDVNAALCRLVGYTKEEMLTLTFQAITHPEDLDEDQDYVRQMLEGTLTSYQIEKRYLHKNGQEVWILLSVVMVHDREGRPLHFVSEMQDITERKQIETMHRQADESLARLVKEQARDNTKLQTLALTDSLTGLYNRRAFRESLSLEFDEGKLRQTLTLLLLDVDNFKVYNDTFGHPAGDLALQQVAQLLLAAARNTDIVARHGGEEFAMILPNTNDAGAKILAERFRKAIENASWIHQDVTASFGVCTMPAGSISDSRRFIEKADAALYESKSRGRNCISYAT